MLTAPSVVRKCCRIMRPSRELPICQQDQSLRLPKPIYEAMPFFLVGVGALFVVLAINRYEYAPTLIVMLLGILCIMGGLLLLAVRLIYRIRSSTKDGD